jgi:hypothetical protein
VAELPLGDADLVVLSACETGLGREAGGEGLLGLQRAFQVAGARTVVASWWQVDDGATQDLMARFYANLWREKLPPLEALRRAQLSVLGGGAGSGGLRGPGSVEHGPAAQAPGRAPPRLWAAWVLSGDPGDLAGEAEPADGAVVVGALAAGLAGVALVLRVRGAGGRSRSEIGLAPAAAGRYLPALR